MKKITLIMFAIVFSFAASAQIQQGQLIIGGSFGFGTSGGSTENIVAGVSTTVDNNKVMTFNIIPSVGYMLTENIALGLGVGYDFQKTTVFNAFTDPTDATNTFDNVIKQGTFALNPFFRYYKPVSEKFYIYGEFAIPIGMMSTKELEMDINDNTGAADGTKDSEAINKTIAMGPQIGLGVNYFISPMIALEANFNLLGFTYASNKITQTDKEGKNGTIQKTSSMNLDFDTDNVFNTGNISVGIKFFL